jgi:hypothetical protein
VTATKPAAEQARRPWAGIGVAVVAVALVGAFALGIGSERWTDGDMFAYLTTVNGDSIVIDPAAMLAGNAAREAAEEDGVIQPGEELPNDFYIQNHEPGPLSIGVASDVEVTVLAFDANGDITETTIGLAQLATAFGGEYIGAPIYGLDAGAFPVTLTVEDNEVTSITQVYLP